MARIGVALLLIVTGTTLLLKSVGWLPSDLGRIYLEWAGRYWPVLLILFGVKIMIGDKSHWIGETIRWVIWLLVAFWIVSIIWSRQEIVI